MRYSYLPEPEAPEQPARPAQAVGFWMLLTCSLVCVQSLAEKFGFAYLPTPEWIARARSPAEIAGLVAGGLTVLAFRHLIRLKSGTHEAFVWHRKLLLLLGGPLLVYFATMEALITSGPMLGAALLGGPVTHRFTVASADPAPNARCDRRIRLQDMRFTTKELCGAPKALVATLTPGEQILVTGRGTPIGLFPATVTRP